MEWILASLIISTNLTQIFFFHFIFLLAPTLGRLVYSSVGGFGVLRLLRLWQMMNAWCHWLQSISRFKNEFLDSQMKPLSPLSKLTIPACQLHKTEQTTRDVSPTSKSGGPWSSDMETAAGYNRQACSPENRRLFSGAFAFWKSFPPLQLPSSSCSLRRKNNNNRSNWSAFEGFEEGATFLLRPTATPSFLPANKLASKLILSTENEFKLTNNIITWVPPRQLHTAGYRWCRFD